MFALGINYHTKSYNRNLTSTINDHDLPNNFRNPQKTITVGILKKFFLLHYRACRYYIVVLITTYFAIFPYQSPGSHAIKASFCILAIQYVMTGAWA